jgi:Ca2+-binding RTX toxin-like protein
MRKTLLLLTTMALALLVAGGVALAATVTCQVGVVCNGTSDADTITGTTSNDTINGLEGNDLIKARDGLDKIDGGPNNDTMNGGPGNDTYKFFPNWGIDRISADSGGVDTLTFPGPRSLGVFVDLTGDGSNTCEILAPGLDPCFTIGGGDYIENVVGTAFEDRLSGNTLNNQITGGGGGNSSSPELMNGEDGSDTYKGYAPGVATGVDYIQDTPVLTTTTNVDKLNLAKFNLADASFGYGWFGGEPGFTFLSMGLHDGQELVGGIFLLDYFDGTSTELCTIKPGTGHIEKIIFADDPNVDFAQVKSFVCGATVRATGNIQEIQLPQSAAPKPESSNGTNGVTTNLQR